MTNLNRPCRTLVEAVGRAVQDVAPAAGLLSHQQVTRELEKRIHEYWGADHGISQPELHATARDISTAARQR